MEGNVKIKASFHFKSKALLYGRDVRLAEYPEGLFDGWCKPTTNVKSKKVYVSEASAPPAHMAGLEDIPEFDEEDSFDAVRLPNAAKSACSDSEDESTFSQDQVLPEATEQLLSPPPTDLSEAVDTPPQPRHPKKMVRNFR